MTSAGDFWLATAADPASDAASLEAARRWAWSLGGDGARLDVLAALAGREVLGESERDVLLGHPSGVVRAAVCRRGDMPADVLRAVAARDARVAVCEEIADHPHCPPDVLARLAGHRSARVQASVACNPGSDDAVVAGLLGDLDAGWDRLDGFGQDAVCAALVARPALHGSVVRTWSADRLAGIVGSLTLADAERAVAVGRLVEAIPDGGVGTAVFDALERVAGGGDLGPETLAVLEALLVASVDAPSRATARSLRLPAHLATLIEAWVRWRPEALAQIAAETDPERLAQLAPVADRVGSVAGALAANPHTPQAVLVTLARAHALGADDLVTALSVRREAGDEDPAPLVAAAARANPNAVVELLGAAWGAQAGTVGVRFVFDTEELDAAAWVLVRSGRVPEELWAQVPWRLLVNHRGVASARRVLGERFASAGDAEAVQRCWELFGALAGGFGGTVGELADVVVAALASPDSHGPEAGP